MLKPTAAPEAIEAEMRRQFRSERMGYDTVAERKRELGRALENIDAMRGLMTLGGDD